MATHYSNGGEDAFNNEEPSILVLETPNAEEVAKAIWQRQRDALISNAISKVKWRDQSLPSRFWDEFVLDAQAILSFLHKKHLEYQKILNSSS